MLGLLPSAAVDAITLNGVYFGTCDRELGVIINVDAADIQLLTLQGVIKTVSRFDIIYLAEYPLGNIPIHSVQNVDAKPVTLVYTLSDFVARELVRGWPIDFSDQSILFLTSDGDELVIAREDIEAVTTVEDVAPVVMKNAARANYYFHYPALFKHCQAERDRATKPDDDNDVYPQQLIGNPLLIKSSLDQLMAGHQLISAYKRNEKFYAVPIIYGNDTSIGLWYNFNSRHGASGARNNSVIPFIISDSSDGPFGFQRRIVTGSDFMPYSVHEEPQTLFSYALKADYFHFSVMFDPSAILTGANYLWKKKELDSHDDRMMEAFHLTGGFDWGRYALELALPSYIIGVRDGDFFANDSNAMFRYGVSYRNHWVDSSLYYGRGSNSTKDTERDSRASDNSDEANTHGDTRNRLTTARCNVALNYLTRWRPMVSLIYRVYEFHRDPDPDGYGAFDYRSLSLTPVATLGYKYTRDITLSGYVAAEHNHRHYDDPTQAPGSDKATHFKAGGAIMLTF